jgi:TolB-like protein
MKRLSTEAEPPQPADRRTFLFEGVTLDLARGYLRDANGQIVLRPKSFDVLRCLVINAGRLVSKEELLEAVWPDVTVCEESLTRCISDVRLALREQRSQIIRRVPRRGYYLDTFVSESSNPAINETSRGYQAVSIPEGPSIAVLPFQNLSADPEQEYFADGLVEDIITALSRYKSLFVIARNSSFTYKGNAVDIKRVGRELGVRYVLEGSVRKAGSRLRITGQLIEASTGSQLWADKIDGAFEDLFELQDKVASSVAGIIDPVLLDAEIRRASDRPTADLTAYDQYLRAVPLVRAWSREAIIQAIVLLEQAIERDPGYGRALAALAFCHSQNVWSAWSEDTVAESEQGRALARRALASGPDDPDAVGTAAGALMNLGDDINVLKGLIDNAVARNPSSAFCWFWSGWMRTFSGEPVLAIEHLEKSLRLDPRATRRAFHLTPMGICHLFQRRFDKAVALLEASFHELPTYPTTTWFLAACYAQMGRIDDARDFAARLGIRPGGPWLRSGSLFRNPEHREFLFSGLRLATGEQA